MDNDTLRIVLASFLGPLFWGCVFLAIGKLKALAKVRYYETCDERYLSVWYYCGKSIGKLFNPIATFRQ